MFIGIEEKDGIQGDKENGAVNNQNTANTKEITYDFMEHKLQIQNVWSEIEFQRIHWAEKAKGKKSRPIIAKFLRYSDHEEVLSQARKLLKDKIYCVFEDMHKELYDLRKAQLKKTAECKKEGGQRISVENILISFS